MMKIWQTTQPPYLQCIQIICPCQFCCIACYVCTIFVVPMCSRSSVSICDDCPKGHLELCWPNQWWSVCRWRATHPIPFHLHIFPHLHRPRSPIECNVFHHNIEGRSLKIPSIPALSLVIQEILEELCCFVVNSINCYKQNITGCSRQIPKSFTCLFKKR